MTEAAEEFELSARAVGDRPPRGTVPLAAGAVGACPACGGPLYAWTKAPAADARREETYVLDRCERCGLGILREGELDVAALVADGKAAGEGLAEVSLPNRRSLQATIGGSTWAAMRFPDEQALATPKALLAVLERGGVRVRRLRQPPLGPNLVWMAQTLLNALTFHPNFAREAAAGRLRPANGRGWAPFAIDTLVTVLALPLVAVASLLLETVAAAARRGGRVVAVIERDDPQEEPASSTSSASSAAESS
jgi:hypothetical protein